MSITTLRYNPSTPIMTKSLTFFLQKMQFQCNFNIIWKIKFNSFARLSFNFIKLVAKGIKCSEKPHILYLFLNSFDKFNNVWAVLQDSLYIYNFEKSISWLIAKSILFYDKCSKSCLPKMHRQTAQTQIRLLLKKQSYQGLPCLLFWYSFCEFQTWKPTFYLEQKEKSVQNLRTFTVCHVDFLILHLPNYTQPTRKLQPHHISEKKKIGESSTYISFSKKLYSHLSCSTCQLLTEITKLLTYPPQAKMALSWVILVLWHHVTMHTGNFHRKNNLTLHYIVGATN